MRESTFIFQSIIYLTNFLKNEQKLFTIKNLLLGSALAFMTSCSDDKETCADCHLVVMNADGSETELLDLEEYVVMIYTN